MIQASEIAVSISYALCFFRDFNTIIGAHEYKGSFSPTRTLIEDFQNCILSNNLMHLSTKGAFFFLGQW